MEGRVDGGGFTSLISASPELGKSHPTRRLVERVASNDPWALVVLVCSLRPRHRCVICVIRTARPLYARALANGDANPFNGSCALSNGAQACQKAGGGDTRSSSGYK
jgi:hypothetical protein